MPVCQNKSQRTQRTAAYLHEVASLYVVGTDNERPEFGRNRNSLEDVEAAVGIHGVHVRQIRAAQVRRGDAGQRDDTTLERYTWCCGGRRDAQSLLQRLGVWDGGERPVRPPR